MAQQIQDPGPAQTKRPVGRPKLPETVIAELKDKILKLENTIKTSQDPMNQLKEMAEIIRIIQRAVKGLGADEDVFLGLINAKDIRERTRLSEPGVLSHSAMRVAASSWPEFSMLEKIAEMEDPYYISEDGEGRKEGILLRQAQSKIDSNLILNMPNTHGGIAQTEQAQAVPKKKGLLDKVLHR